MPRFSYANVMSTIAVFIALGGTSYAVTKLPKGAVGERELRKDSVTGTKVKDGTLTGADLAPGTLSTGPRGPRGADGPKGDVGPAGPGAGAAEAWRPLEYSDGWTNYNTDNWPAGSYRKDQLGVVHLRGLITRASGIPAMNSVIATLPPGYRPKRTRTLPVHTGEAPHQIGRLDLYPDGRLFWISGGTGEPDYTSLELIEFDLD